MNSINVTESERSLALARSKESLVDELMSLRLEVEKKRQAAHEQGPQSVSALGAKFQAAQAIAKFLYWECSGERFEWEANPEVLSEFLGIAVDNVPLTDRDFTKLIHEQDRDRVAARYDCAHRKAVDYEVEYRLVIPNGDIRYIRDTGIARVNSSGECLGHTGILQDCTEQKLTQRQREQMIEQLEASNYELERFAYTVSHDLKAPLISIRGFLGLLEKDVEQNDFERFKADLRRIDLATVSMRKVLDGLLDLSRIGRVVAPSTETPLADVVDDVKLMLAGLLSESPVSIELVGERKRLYGDRIRLVELIQNLVENAVNNMGDQHQPRIEIGCHENEGQVVCYVSDNGVGLDRRFHHKIFGLFETLGGEGSRTGIGLALAKRIVEHHGGRIWIESEGVGKGSKFYFSLPTKAGRAQAGATTPKP